MVLARARCSNWPSLPHRQLRPVLSPETIASQTCRVCADPLTGVQDLLVGEQLCHKFVAYKESVHLKQRHHMPGRHVASRLLPGSMSIGGNQESDDKQAATKLKTHYVLRREPICWKTISLPGLLPQTKAKQDFWTTSLTFPDIFSQLPLED